MRGAGDTGVLSFCCSEAMARALAWMPDEELRRRPVAVAVNGSSSMPVAQHGLASPGLPCVDALLRLVDDEAVDSLLDAALCEVLRLRPVALSFLAVSAAVASARADASEASSALDRRLDDLEAEVDETVAAEADALDKAALDEVAAPAEPDGVLDLRLDATLAALVPRVLPLRLAAAAIGQCRRCVAKRGARIDLPQQRQETSSSGSRVG